MKARSAGVRILVVLACTVSGCAIPNMVAGGTVGEQFRQVVGDIDARCRARKLGPYLDPTDREFRNKQAFTDCEIIEIEPRDWRTVKRMKLDSQAYAVPEHWLATPEGRFAHSIKLPASFDLVADDMNGSDGESIFQRLCDRYAGERVFRMEKGVDGVRQGRPYWEKRGYSNLIFWTKEKGDVGYTPEDYFVKPPLGRYDFLEVPIRQSGSEELKFQLMSRAADIYSREMTPLPGKAHNPDREFAPLEKRSITSSIARFAFTWRGIWPGQALEHGIEGSELIVYRVDPFEVLGASRNFRRHGPYVGHSDPKITWTEFCKPKVSMKAHHQFVFTVLEPKNP